jgi:ligand-binding sensor domain-containing protein/two-component sensor histidine kinase
MKKALLIPVILGFAASGLYSELFSQTLPFRAYSIEQGLSESVVHDLFQSSNGYIWIATGYGINRFDGSEIMTWLRHQGLNDNQINEIKEDDQGRLWIGTDSGINVMENDTILSPDFLDDLQRYSVTSLHRDSNNDWWIGTDGAGIWLLDANRLLTQYTSVHGLAGNSVREITETPDDILWFATNEGLTNLDDGNFNTFTTSSGLPENNLNTIASDEDGLIWIGSDSGLTILEDNEFRQYHTGQGLSHNSILTITATGSGKAWIGTENGASFFDNGHFRNFTVEQGLTSDIINSTLMDREGHIWFGTLGGGANIYLDDYFHNYTTDHGLTSNVVTGFDEDDNGHFWISTFGGGVMQYDGSQMFTYDESDGLIDNRVFTTYSDNSGKIWVGTRNGISIIEDGEVQTPPERFRDIRMIRSFYKDPDNGDFWIGTYDNGIYHFTDDDLVIYDDTNYLVNNTVMTIQKDEEGRMWFATYGGVVVLDEGEFDIYTIEDGLPSNGVISIYLDQDNQVWVSTFSGFARLDIQNRITETFSSSFGHSNTLAYFMFQDQNKHYWIGTNIGIIRFDYNRYNAAGSTIERDLSFELVNREQGLITNEMNAGGLHIDRTGAVWLGTVEGISRFFPERFPVRDVPPIAHFKEIMFAGQTVSTDQRITRRHDRNFLQFEVTGISFAAPSQILFEYRLEGVDEGWTHSYDRLIRYPSLSPGEYSFQVRAYNSSGTRSASISSYEFEIAPPIWLQWWFFVLVGLIVIGVILFIYNYYRVRRLVEMERMRVQIASDLHDDVGASLTELALQTDFLRTGQLEESVATTLKQIGEHSRKIVSALDDIVWSIDARNDTVGDLTDRMQDHAYKLLSPKGIMIHFNFSGLDTDIQLPVQVKENLYLIFKESINNIAKHSNADTVHINLSMKGNKYMLDVADNGTVKTNGRKTGQGLRNINMRAKRMNASAIIEKENGFNIKVTGSLN